MILAAQDIRERCIRGMITPWTNAKTSHGMSYGVSSAGYDIRIDKGMLLYAPGFALASTLERFKMPSDLLGIVHDKSTWARRGMAVQNTVIEPGWEGYLTLELTNHGREILELKDGCPIAQIIFHKLTDHTNQPYRGKYQDQKAGPQGAILDDDPARYGKSSSPLQSEGRSGSDSGD